MATTSLPDELKQLATTAAQELGLSTHSFLVGATHQVADAVEQRSQFIAQGRAAKENSDGNCHERWLLIEATKK